MATHSTCEAFRPHFDALAKLGYFKIVLKDVSPTKRLLHDIYRLLIWFLVLLYNLQFAINIIQARHSKDELADTLFIMLATMSCVGKQTAFNLRSDRVERLLRVIDGPTFAATSPHNLGIVKQNARSMARLLKFYHVLVGFCGCLWTSFPLINRAQGEEVVFFAYIPFDTQQSPVFELVLIYLTALITVQGLANVTQDCTIVSFYVQAKVQIQMFRYNLEHLVDEDDIELSPERSNGTRVNADRSAVLQQRFKKCAEHYRQISWFCKEIESIFGEAMAFQFFIMAGVICMTMYKIAGLNIFSAEFVSIVTYLGCQLGQFFIYCYYGTQFKTESDYINQSVYFCDWVSLSPPARRQLLVLMQHCQKPMTPKIARIVPMTLDTYISVLKSSYTMFTVLDRQ